MEPTHGHVHLCHLWRLRLLHKLYICDCLSMPSLHGTPLTSDVQKTWLQQVEKDTSLSISASLDRLLWKSLQPIASSAVVSEWVSEWVLNLIPVLRHVSPLVMWPISNYVTSPQKIKAVTPKSFNLNLDNHARERVVSLWLPYQTIHCESNGQM